MEDEIQDIVGSLVDQLKDTNIAAQRADAEREPLKKEDLQNFVIQKSGTLVEDALQMVQNMRDFIVSSPNSDDISALADLINATSSAIDNLNKINLQDMKTNTSVKLKTMEIEAKKDLQETDNTNRLMATREEVLKMILNNAKPIEAEIVEDKRLTD
jgi:soluble P-type ATPase